MWQVFRFEKPGVGNPGPGEESVLPGATQRRKMGMGQLLTPALHRAQARRASELMGHLLVVQMPYEE